MKAAIQKKVPMTFFEQYDLVRASGLFDAQYYLDRNPDVASAGVDPLEHFLNGGEAEGRDPGPAFDRAFYLDQCAARGLSPVSPLLHYLIEGRADGLLISNPTESTPVEVSAECSSNEANQEQITSSILDLSRDSSDPQIKKLIDILLNSGLFDADYYEAIQKIKFPSHRKALEHFVYVGYFEGIRPNYYFDPDYYLTKNPDLLAAGVHPFAHYVLSGDQEGRQPSAIFSTRWYREKYDIKPSDLALAHYLKHRSEWKYSPIPEFDVEFYRKNNKNQKKQGVDPLEHYLEIGFKEGLSPTEKFNASEYISKHMNGAVDIAPLLHYLTGDKILQGRAEIKTDSDVRNQTGANDRAEISNVSEVSVLDSSAENIASREPKGDRQAFSAIISSGLFEFEYYCAAYGMSFDNIEAAVWHFINNGSSEGKRPNFYFDPGWYWDKYPDVREAGVNPLHHYIASGDLEGRLPSLFFDTGWYRLKHDIAGGELALKHYLRNRFDYTVSPLPDFDVLYYSRVYPDVVIAKADLFEHFAQGGYLENRHPAEHFNVGYHVAQYLDGDFSIKALMQLWEDRRSGRLRKVESAKWNLDHRKTVKQFTSPGPYFEEVKKLSTKTRRDAKLLAYYLPQFHTIEENERFWGKGFTEWTNVVRGVSRFKGHYQPRVPRDLGFYSLENASPVLRRQADMAKGAGLDGFIFYYYWFNGRRLMDRPIEQFLLDPSIDMSFCLMWANENWTRRWDGADDQVLMSQQYRLQDDDAIVEDWVRHFKDSRYIRIGGRPVLMIYRPGVIPNAAESVARWRMISAEKHGENPIFVMAQTAGDVNPYDFGMDGAIEFPPHKLIENVPNVNGELNDLEAGFTGNIYSYDSIVSKSLNEPPPYFPLIKTVVPGWDNDARRQGAGIVFEGSHPTKYEYWLKALVSAAAKRPFYGEAIVCINAWNEWAEAAYLEPDQYFGAAYLNATARAVTASTPQLAGNKVLLVGHDAFPGGAQHLLLSIARELREKFGLELEFLLLGGGELEAEYRKTASLTVVRDIYQLDELLAPLKKKGFVTALVNTVAAGWVVPSIKKAGLNVVTLVHEMPTIIRDKGLTSSAEQAIKFSDNILFPAEIVRDNVLNLLGLKTDQRMMIRPQGLYNKLTASDAGVESIRQQLGIKPHEKVVLGVGYADMRKGFDLFVQLWRQLNLKAKMPVHCCWIGNLDPGLGSWLGVEIEAAIKAGSFHRLDYRSDISAYYLASDVFVLTSREDPFPSVALEALSVGLEVFAFENSGGIPSLLEKKKLGKVIPYGDVTELAVAVQSTLNSPVDTAASRRRKNFVGNNLDFGGYVKELLKIILPSIEQVSVVVPNFNYASFLPQRLETIFKQSYPVTEIIVSDDASTDNSLSVIDAEIRNANRTVEVVKNLKNSGSVFRQWRRLAEMATSEFIWIAEADDLAEPEFIESLIGAMSGDPEIALGFTDSRAIDHDGKTLWASYKPYYEENGSEPLAESATYSGQEFIRKFLATRNLIVNASGVIWRRKALLEALKTCERELATFRVAGDWRLYLEVLSGPSAKVAYVANAYNIHRRHSQSVTSSLSVDKHINEIERCHSVAARIVQLTRSDIRQQKNYVEETTAKLKERISPSKSDGIQPFGKDLIRQLEVASDLKARMKFQQFSGKLKFKQGAPTALLVAHAAAEHLFGSERSFIDMLDGLNAVGLNVVVVLPRNAPLYTNAIRLHCVAVLTFTYDWWRSGKAVASEATELFERVIRELDISVVHCNTIMLREPYIAARNCKVPSVVHVRELITEDEALTNLIGLTPEEVVKETFKNFDWIICNSKSTADVFDKPGRTFVVNNTIDIDKFKTVSNTPDSIIRFGLISSNIAKKGIQDVVDLAVAVEPICPNAEFLLIGPITEPVQKLIELQKQGKIPSSIKFPGYAESPLDGVKQVNVVLNFSHFAESFGRTVLEAMAACRPVIAYEHGAIPELIRHKVSGYLVPFRRPELAAAYVKELCESPEKIQLLGKSGQEAAQRLYGLDSYRRQFKRAYHPILAEAIAVKSGKGFRVDTSAGPVIKPARLQGLNDVQVTPKVAYFCWHFPVPSETFVLNELEVLVRNNVDVVVFCRQSPHRDFKPGFDIKFERVDSADTLARRLLETGRTIVHAHFVYPTVTDMVWPACEKAGIPFTFIAHAQDIFKYENDRNNRLAEIGASPLCKKLFTLSRYHLEFAVSRGFPRSKISINPNAVKVDAFVKSQVVGRELRKTRRIVAVHRFVPKKGLDILIRAAAHLKDLKIRIEIYGYGELEAEYKEIVSKLKLKNVFIHGALTQEEVAAEMRNADLFACPAVRTETGDMDGLPTSIVESMAAGLPVLTTAVGALPELVVDELTGIVAEPTPEGVAAAIRRFYAMPNGQVRSLIRTASARASQAHDAERLVGHLLRVWKNCVVDIVVVSWNNLEELRGVIQCVLDNTASPYHLIICDNQSEREPVPQYLDALWEREDRVTVVHNNRNAMVGPGTNLAMAQGRGDVVIYVCGKEGFSFSNGWERPFINYLNENPKVGQAGTLCRSPTYMTGKDYPTGIPLFDKFRNKVFATDNPDRGFSHVQGGLFAMRRSMVEQIGGFSDEVPHSYTDVEFSYYVESMGWELGDVPSILGLFNKTRPSLSQRFDESLLVAHPVMLDELPIFKRVIAGQLHHCNLCNWFGEEFSSDRLCPECGSSPEDRSLYCWLSQTFFMYRRLPTLGVGLTGAIEEIWASQFQGPRLSAENFIGSLKEKGKLPNRDNSMWVIFLRLGKINDRDALIIMKELRRLLRKDGVVILQCDSEIDDMSVSMNLIIKTAEAHGVRINIKEHQYASLSISYSWRQIIEFSYLT